jgi:DNA polymerase (family X)
MTKEEIAGILEQVAALLELKGENPFKVRAYINAVRAIETFGGNIPDLQDEEAVAKNPGFNFVTKQSQMFLDNSAVLD